MPQWVGYNWIKDIHIWYMDVLNSIMSIHCVWFMFISITELKISIYWYTSLIMDKHHYCWICSQWACNKPVAWIPQCTRHIFSNAPLCNRMVHTFILHSGAFWDLSVPHLYQSTWSMMTSSTGNIFRVTGTLWGESRDDRWFPSQRPVTRRSFDVFVDLCLNKRLSKQSRHMWYETS